MLGGVLLIKSLKPVFDLEGLFYSSNKYVAKRIISAAFNNAGKKGYEILREGVFHKNEYVREYSLLGIGFALKKTGEEGPLEEIQKYLQRTKENEDEDWYPAAKAMGMILQGREDAIEYFKPYLTTKDEIKRYNLIIGLSIAYEKTQNNEILEILKMQIKNARKETSFPDPIIAGSLLGVGLIYRGAENYALLRIIKPYLKNRFEDIRLAAAYAATLIFEGTGNEYIFSLLKPLFWDVTKVKTGIAIATSILFKNIGEEALGILTPLKKYKTWGAHVAVALGLGSALKGTRNIEATQLIKKFLKSTIDETRMISGVALADIYHGLRDEAFNDLQQMIEKGKSDERGAAIFALGHAYEKTKNKEILEYLKEIERNSPNARKNSRPRKISYTYEDALKEEGYVSPWRKEKNSITLAIGKIFKESKDKRFLEIWKNQIIASDKEILDAVILAMGDVYAEKMPDDYWRSIMCLSNLFKESFWDFYEKICTT